MESSLGNRLVLRLVSSPADDVESDLVDARTTELKACLAVVDDSIFEEGMCVVVGFSVVRDRCCELELGMGGAKIFKCFDWGKCVVLKYSAQTHIYGVCLTCPFNDDHDM